MHTLSRRILAVLILLLALNATYGMISTKIENVQSEEKFEDTLFEIRDSIR